MDLLGWIVSGFIIGAIAKLIHPGPNPGGFFVTTLIGVGGAILAGFIGEAVGLYRPGDAPGYILSTGGAVLILVIYHAVAAKSPQAGTT
jgi:uncharacterized membrane protein YeaQ/YmgE (transglycosylase-associated protein family)